MRKAAVSVVIPVYNNGPYIAAAVRSVLDQSYPPTEVIVVDDGSTDDTAAAVHPYKKQIKYVYQKNRGEPGARNRGLQEATCEYVAFLDGDDLWLPNKLELQMQYLAQHPRCALVYTDMCTFDEKGIVDASVKERFRLTLPAGRIFHAIFMKALFGSGSVVLRRDCIETAGYFDETFLVGCDYEMWLRMSRHFDFGVVDKPLLKYRYHSQMSTLGMGLKMFNQMPWEVAVLKKILQLYPEVWKELGPTMVKRRLSRPYGALAYARFRAKDYRSARSLSWKALGYWPGNRRYWAIYCGTFFDAAQVSAARRLYRSLFASEQNKSEKAEVKVA